MHLAFGKKARNGSLCDGVTVLPLLPPHCIRKKGNLVLHGSFGEPSGELQGHEGQQDGSARRPFASTIDGTTCQSADLGTIYSSIPKYHIVVGAEHIGGLTRVGGRGVGIKMSRVFTENC